MISRPSTPRIQPVNAATADEETRAILGRALPGPDGKPLNIFGTMAHHPGLLKRWMSFGTALLLKGVLPARDRELAILRTGWNCRAAYEWGQHAAIGRASGLSDEEIARVVDGPDAAGWTPLEAAVLRASDELHTDGCVSDPTWATLAEHYDDKGLIELVMVIGQYHLVSFFLNSAGVQREEGVEDLPAEK